MAEAELQKSNIASQSTEEANQAQQASQSKKRRITTVIRIWRL